jgi:hypothetical protein
MSPVLTFVEIVGDVEMLVFMNDSVVLVMLRLDSHRRTSPEPILPHSRARTPAIIERLTDRSRLGTLTLAAWTT